MGSFVNEKDIFLQTPLHLACEDGNIDVVKILLQNGALIDTKDKDGETSLDIARKHNNQNVIRYFLEYQDLPV